jgi:hypothetical protein
VVNRRRARSRQLGAGEAIEEASGRLNGKLVGQRQEVLVAGDEDSALLLCER